MEQVHAGSGGVLPLRPDAPRSYVAASRDCELKEVEYDTEVSPDDRQARSDAHPMELDI